MFLAYDPERAARTGDQGVVGAAFAAPVAVFIGPFGHLHGVNHLLVREETTMAMEVGPQA